MNVKLRFGVGTAQNVSWVEMVKRWKSIESLGFDSVWVADQFVVCSQPKGQWFDGWTLLPALATQTSKITIGTAVTAIPWHNPAFLARRALTVDHISKGRLELGMGTGLPGDCGHKMTGIEDWSAGERVARFGEFVEVVDLLLRRDVVSYDGRYYKLQEAAMNPPPFQDPRPPFMIAAMGKKMLKHVARYADVWNTMGGFSGTLDNRLGEISKQNALLDKYCCEIGREPQSIRRSCVMFDPGMYVNDWRIGCYDSADAFENEVRGYMDVGMTEFLMYYPFREDQVHIFEKIAREVIPELKEKYSK